MSSMKKVFICFILFAFILCGCSVQGDARADKDEPANAVYVKSVWITYFELEKLTANSNTAKDFEKAVKSAFKENKIRWFQYGYGAGKTLRRCVL